MNKKIAILQSNYIPWKGYFDIINSVDEFIVYDDVQFTKRDWRNRNSIKSPNGLIWLTIPVNTKGKQLQKINETLISDSNWAKKHWNAIKLNYSKAPYFKSFAPLFEETYLNTKSKYLSDVNNCFIQIVNGFFGIKTKITQSTQYQTEGTKTEKLISICKQTSATEYLSGPAAKNYLDEEQFKKENIKVSWMDYSTYPEYRQLYPPFVHQVSIIDLIFNEGKNAMRMMKSF